MSFVWSKLIETGVVVADRNQVLQASAILKAMTLNGVALAPAQFVGFVRTTAQIIYRAPFYAVPAPSGPLAYIDVLITVEYLPEASIANIFSVNVTQLDWSMKAVQ
jgi:hypothetical protein